MMMNTPVLKKTTTPRVAHKVSLSLVGMTPSSAAKYLERLPIDQAFRLFSGEPRQRQIGILQTIDVAVGARLLRMDEHDDDILKEIPESQRQQLTTLLSWPDDSIGSRMSVVYYSLPSDRLIGDIDWDELTASPSWARDHTIYVCDDGQFRGTVPEDVVYTSSDSVSLGSLCTRNERIISPLEDQESVIVEIEANGYDPVPVVHEGAMIGVIRHDDAAEIIRQESTEDAERQGGSSPLETPYLSSSPWHLWKKRIGWILVLFVAESYTSTVLSTFEDELSSVIALSFFIPLLIGTGGNTGTQITSTLIRAIAVDGVRLGDVAKIIRKEMATGLLIGLCMSVAGIIRATILGVGFQVALVVAVTLVAIVLWSSLVSAILPLLIKKLRMDPAVVSSPFISTFVDGTGLIIYFEIARLLMF